MQKFKLALFELVDRAFRYSSQHRQIPTQVHPSSACLVVLALAITAALANVGAAQVSDSTLSTMGLQNVWRSQMQMPVEEGRIVSTHLWTNPNDRKSYAELTLPPASGGLTLVGSRVLRVSADQLDASGKPIGMELAKKEVETRATRMLGRASGIPAVEVTIPMVYLVVVTGDGFVQTYDAESGEKLWASGSGSPRLPAAPASVSDVGVVVAQGSYLYLYDWKSGKELSRRQMKRASTAGVALIDTTAFVSSLSGQLMAFNLSETPTLNSWSYRLYGRTVGIPATANRPNKLVAFATQDGLVTVFSAGEETEPWFNFEARTPLGGPISFHGDGLYVGDVTGKVTKVALDRTGRIAWRLMIGDALGAPPMVYDQTVYVTTDIGNMFAADDRTGIPTWQSPAPRVKSILAATKDKVYCRSLIDRLLTVDAKTGKTLGETSPAVIDVEIVNHLNDRIYFISKAGQISCLRQAGKDYVLPHFHQALPTPTETPKPRSGTAPAAVPAESNSAASADTADPFGAAMGAADAFAVPGTDAADDTAADAADPFATPPVETPAESPF